MEDLPQIPLVDNVRKFYSIVYEENKKLQDYKVLG